MFLSIKKTFHQKFLSIKTLFQLPKMPNGNIYDGKFFRLEGSSGAGIRVWDPFVTWEACVMFYVFISNTAPGDL